jgi:outer membrane protein assembly factor BamB
MRENLVNRYSRMKLVLLTFVLAATPLCMAQSIGIQITADHQGQLYFPSMSPPLTQRWSINLGLPASYPIIVGNRIFVIGSSTTTSNLYALDAGTGNVLWSQPPPAGYVSWVAATYDNGVIFVVPVSSPQGGGAGLFAFSAVDGHQLWSALTLENTMGVLTAPTALNGVVYVSYSVGEMPQLTAVRELDGAMLWTTQTPNVTSAPAVTADGVYVSVGCAPTYKLDPATGAQIWLFQIQCDGSPVGPAPAPAVYRSLVYVLGGRTFRFSSPRGRW